ncbi:T9SS type A sorting domain-containing protein [Adhaeribacter soli]|nr:T9SS type A sorting domain-containing protein [Adhaeribacter soli]
MIQPTGTEWSPGTITLRIKNDHATDIITSIDIAYDILIRNNENRSNSFNFSYSSDNNSYINVGALDYVSPLTSNSTSFVKVGGTSPSRSTTINGLNILPGQYFYIRWTGDEAGGSGSMDEFALDDIKVTPVLTPVVSTPTITTSNLATLSYCAGNTVTVEFTTTGTYNAGNVFTAQLSDASGSFTSPIQSATGTNPISLTIPTTAATGNAYKVRVIASDPATEGSASAAFTINAKPATNNTSVSPGSDQTVDLATTGSLLTASAAEPSTFSWKFGASASGPFNNTIAGISSNAYTITGSHFPGAGEYYLVAEATSNGPCSTIGISNPVKVTVTASQPIISTSVTSLLAFSAPAGTTGESLEQSYTLTGSALAGDVTITAPLHYKVSFSSGSNYSNQLTLSPVSGAVNATIYVVYDPAVAGTHNGSISHTSLNATTKEVAVSGSSNPTISITGTQLTFSALAGGQSAEQSYQISGTALTSDVQVAAPAHFKITKTAGTGYAGSLLFTPNSNGVVNATIYVVYAPTVGGAHSGDIQHASAGASVVLLGVSGNSTPTLQVTGTFTPVANQTINTNSTAQQFSVSGSKLTGNVVITAPAEFQVSRTSATTGFSNSVSFTPSAGSVTSDYWIRFSPTVAGAHSSNVTVTSVNDGLLTNIAVSGTAVNQPVTIHYWAFNSGAGSVANDKWPMANAINATSGSGTITHDIAATEDFAGTTDNAESGYAAGASFSAVNSANNGKAIVFNVPTTGYEGLSFSFSSRVNGTSGFSTYVVEYSTNGTDFNLAQTFTGKTNTSFATSTVDLTSIPAANNNPNFKIRMTISGATSSSGNVRFDNIKLAGNLLPPTIITSNVTNAPYCAGTSISVAFSTTGTFGSGNTFTAQLSDANGSFATPLISASGTSPISVGIPGSAVSGSNYKVRVIGSSPATTGSESAPFSIKGTPASNITTLITGGQSLPVNGTGATLTVSSEEASIYTWKFGTDPNGPYNTIIKSGSTNTYQLTGADFAAPGEYYLVVEAVSVCGNISGTSNEIKVTVTAPKPVINVSTNGLAIFNAPAGVSGTSAEQSFTVDGTGLTADIVVTAPAQYLVSATSGSGFSNSVNLVQVSGTVAATVYVVYDPSVAGTHTDSIALTTSGATTKKVGVSGESNPLLTSSETSLSFTALANSQSVEKTYTISGKNLTADLTITTNSNFKISTVSGSGFSTSPLTISPVNGVIPNTTIYVVYAPATGGIHNGSILNESAGASTVTLSVDGNSAPTLNITGSFATVSNQVVHSHSVGQLFAIAAGKLTGNVVISAPANFQVSGTSATAGFTDMLTLNPSGAAISDNIWIRYSPEAAGSHSDYITVASVADGISQQIAVNGSSILAPVEIAGELLLEDNFIGKKDDPISGAGWTSINSGNPILFSESGLDYLNYGSTKIGTGITIAATGLDYYKTFKPVNGNGVLYLSAIINTATSSTGDYFLNLTELNGSGGVTTGYRGRIFIKNSGNPGFINFGISNTGTSTIWSGDYPKGMNHLIVVRYEFNTSNQTQSSTLYINPNTFSEAASTEKITATDNTTSSIPLNIGAVSIRQGNGPVLTLDGLRVGTGWGAVLGNPSFINPVSTLAPGNYNNVHINASGGVINATGTVVVNNNLTLTNGKVVFPTNGGFTVNGTFNGGSANSYIEGFLAQTVATTNPVTLFFPVAKAGNYRPITLDLQQNSVTPTLYTAEQFESNPPTRPLPVETIKNISAVRYFSINKGAGANVTEALVKLSYGADDVVTDKASLSIVKSNPSNTWEDIGLGGSGGTANGSGEIQSTVPFTTFSDFVLANRIGGTNPLPVELMNFTAKAKNTSVQLNWETATEKNNAYFSVERSATGDNFEAISRVEGKGNSTSVQKYQALDNAPLAGMAYYRLKQVDYDGTVNYSKVISINLKGEKERVVLYPNPAKSELNISLPATSGKAVIRVMNLLGQQVLAERVEVGNAIKLNVQNLPAGTYQVMIEADQVREVRRFVKVGN